MSKGIFIMGHEIKHHHIIVALVVLGLFASIIAWRVQNSTDVAHAVNPAFSWAKRLGGGAEDFGGFVAVSPNGNIVNVGYIEGNADLNGDGDSTDGGAESGAGYGGSDVFISVFDATGAYLWSKRLGSSSYDYTGYVAVDSNNRIIVAGYVEGKADLNGDGDDDDGGAESAVGYGSFDSFVSVFDSSGTHVWSERLGNAAADYGLAVDVDGSDNIIIVGSVAGNADLNGDGDSADGGAESATGYGSDDIYVTKFNSSGTHIWAKRLGGASSDSGNAVAVMSDDSIALTGYIVGASDLNGDGDSTDGGAESATGYGSTDNFISVFNSGGTHVWAKRVGGTGDDSANGIAINEINNTIAITGYVDGNADMNGDGDSTDGGAESGTGYTPVDVFVSLFDSSGAHMFARRLGGAGYDIGYGLVFDGSGNIFLAGFVDGNADLNGDGDSTDGGAESGAGYGNRDTIVSVFDSTGTFLWAERFGGTSVDTGISLAIDTDENILLTGYVTGAADMNGDGDSTDGGAESAVGYGGTDVFISKFLLSDAAIPTPAGASCSGSLSVSVVVDGGTATRSDVDLFLSGAVMDPDRTYQLGCTFQQVSASLLGGYTQTFSGACSPTGSVLVTSGTTQNCVVTFTSLATPTPSLSPVVSVSSSPLSSPSATPSPSLTPPPSLTPAPSLVPTVTQAPIPPTTPDIPIPSTPPPAPPAPLSVVVSVITAVASALANNPVTSSAAFTLISLLPLLSVSASAVLQNLNTASTFSSLAQTTGEMLGLKRKPTVWGCVYDSVTKRPLSFVKIELRDAQQRVLETKFADKDGRYGFLTNPQALNLPSLAVSINPVHNGYQFPSQRVLSDPDFFAYDHIYKGGLVTINQGAVVNYNIPLDSTAGTSMSGTGKTPLPGLQSLAVRALDVAFWAGLVILPYNAYMRPSLWTIGLVAFFLLANGLRISAKLARPYGVILGADARPLPFALITVDDAANKRLDFAVSDELGRFFLLTSPESHHLTLHTPAQVVPAKTTTYPLKKKKGWVGEVVQM
jgi:hypothetical protein